MRLPINSEITLPGYSMWYWCYYTFCILCSLLYRHNDKLTFFLGDRKVIWPSSL